jgi:hypothetical protein
MGNHMDPGPPLISGDEFCPDDPPTGMETLRAVGTALLVVILGGAGWFVVVLATQRLWGVVMVLVGGLSGYFINQAAGRHRSLTLGLLAGGATLCASALGYGLLFLPFVDGTVINRSLDWTDLIKLAVAMFLAYRLAGAKSHA